MLPVLLFPVLLFPVKGQAQPAAWYGDIALGFGFAENLSLDTPGSSAEFDFGLKTGAFSMGRHLGRNWRLELELAHRENDLETLNWPAAGGEIHIHPNDAIKADSILLNAIRTFRIGALEPYLGAGLGAADVRLRMGEVIPTGPGRISRTPLLDDDARSTAVQLIAGFNVPLGPKLELGFDYRLWHAPSLSATTAGAEALDLKHTVHTGLVHLRYLFSSERQPPPATVSSGNAHWTLGLHLGAGNALDAEIENSFENLDAFRTGPVLALSLGYRVSPNWRLELEASERSNDVEVVDFNPETGQFSASGDVKATSLMGNATYRFRPDRSIRPFLGAGLGASRLRYRIVTRDQLYLDDQTLAPAVQFVAGLDIALTERLDFVADFRSWYAFEVSMQRPDGSDFRTTHWVQSLTLGLRFPL